MDRYDIISGVEPPPTDSTKHQLEPVGYFLSPSNPEARLGIGSESPMPSLYGAIDTGEYSLIDISMANTDSTANFPALEVTGGDIVVENGRVRSLDPVGSRDLTTKSYVDHLFHKLSGSSFRDRFVVGLVFASFMLNIMLWVFLMMTR